MAKKILRRRASAKEIEQALDMVSRGFEADEIAVELNRPKPTIYKWLQKHTEPTRKIRRMDWTTELDAIMNLNISDNIKKAAIRELVSG